MSINLTEKAAQELKTILDREVQEKRLSQQAGLRLIVQGGGCAGLAYRMGFDENQRPDDRVLQVDGIKFLVDQRSHLYLEGAEIDFQDNDLGRGFVFNNPNSSGSCGCGHSCA